MIHSNKGSARWRTVLAALVVSALACLGLAATQVSPSSAAAFPSFPSQSGPYPVGNLLSYANSNFESGAGDWVGVSDVSTLTQDTSAHDHGHSLKAVASGTGTIQLKLGDGTTADQINLPKTGGEYKIGAFVRGPATTGHLISFDLACYDNTGTWIGWQSGSTVSLNSNNTWQYVEDDITVPSNCAQTVGAPRINATGFNANGNFRVDDVIFAPYRAALAIGQHGSECSTCVSYTPTQWYNTWQTLGSVGQNDKEFNASLPSTFSGTNCSGDEAKVGSTSYSLWPLCIIAYKDPVTSQSAMNTFLASVPANQEIILVWHQEPEGDTFGNQPGCSTGLSDAAAFVCESKIQGGYIHASSSDTANIYYAQDSSGYNYRTGGPGANCSWITPFSNNGSGADMYLMDHYNNGTVNGGNLNNDNGSDQWKNWLNCATQQNGDGLGFGEYGLDNSPIGPASLCTASTSNAQHLDTALKADQSYLSSLPMSGDANLNNPQPFVVWHYWYDNYGAGSHVCTLFDNTYSAITDWEAGITANGGGA